LIGVPGINRYLAPLMQPDDVDTALDGLKTQGSSQEDIDWMPGEMAEAAYHLWQLPTYLDQWKTLIASVATISGANPRYALTAEQLSQIQQPVQIIWGENDVFGGLDTAREMAKAMPQARLHEMSTGHLPFIDRPQETGSVIRDFLSGLTQEPQPELEYAVA
jgi:pimeloyl-ACP methyl ester carboxylesterase